MVLHHVGVIEEAVIRMQLIGSVPGWWWSWRACGLIWVKLGVIEQLVAPYGRIRRRPMWSIAS